MRRARTGRLLYEVEEADNEDISSSSWEEGESDTEEDEVLSDVEDEDEREHEQPGPSSRRPVQREHWRRSRMRSRSPQAQPRQSSEPWKTENDPDTAPQSRRFMPHRVPGAQVNLFASHSPLDLFKLYFSTKTMRALCKNTNQCAANNQKMGKKYKWEELEVWELYKFFGLLIYTSLVSLPSVQDYWKLNSIISVPFPATIMTRDRFRALLWNIHPGDPEEDIRNVKEKGTGHHDKLSKIRPLMDDIRSACQAHYHPKRELTVHKRQLTKSGIKLFVLADSNNGYTINLNVYFGKTGTQTVHGQAYEAVMNLIHPSNLGTGYHIYMDSFYTSPRLLLDLNGMKFGACGPYKESRKGCPTGRANSLTNRSERGTVRWIREGALLFVKWMNAQEVSVCSTIHPALSDEVIKTRVKDGDGHRAVKNIPCPTPIVPYNKNIRGVNLTNRRIQHYSTHLRISRWYGNLFLHFVDIAAANAYILHCDISSMQQVKPMTHKDFLVELVSQLCGVDNTGMPLDKGADHVPVAITMATEGSKKATQGRRICQHCNKVEKKRHVTPWKCKSCDVALCVIVDRNCFEEWHK